jgi:hypothetical protein
MLFWDISPDGFLNSFNVGEMQVTQPGKYALAYSLRSVKDYTPAHGASLIVDYGKLEIDPVSNVPKMCVIPLECINSTVSALPYDINNSIVNSIEWLFLK